VLQLIKKARKFLTGKEAGASLVEYGLLVGLIAVVCVAAVAALGVKIDALFDQIVTALP
jgi:pilus assembly protein Flp/PilA